MIRDRRIFHAVAFHSPLVKNISDVNKLWPSKLISKIENLSEINSKIDVEHIHYYSKMRYSLSQELEDIIVKRDDGNYFAYSLYLLGFYENDKYITVISAPFLVLLNDVFERTHNEIRGKEFGYRQVILRDLVKAINENRHSAGRVKLTQAEFMVTGDDAVKIITLKGSNIIHSETYDNLRETLKDTGIALTPRKCCILYDDHEGCRFALITDKFGNMSFRVGKDGRNLPWAEKIFSYLTEEALIRDTLVFPPDRKADEEEGSDG